MSVSQLLLLLGMFMLTEVALGVEGDTFRPLASYLYGYDSNLFRLANDEQAMAELGTPIESETYQSLGIGFDLDWKQGRQRVVSRMQTYKTHFSHYSTLDYKGNDLNLEWQWVLGNQLSGRLGDSYKTTLGSYRDVAALVSNTNTGDRLYLDANYLIHPRWQASFRAASFSQGYNAPSQKSSAVDIDSRTLAAYYLGNSPSRVGIEYRADDGRFPNRTVTPPVLDVAYQERNLGLVTYWGASGKSRLNARIGRIERRYPNLKSRDFSGLEWRFDGTWSVSGKSLLGGSLFRELRNAEIATANYAVTDGGSLNFTWLALPKTRLQADIGYENLDYDTGTRQDKVATSSLAAVYEAWPGGELSTAFRRERRKSTSASLSYDSRSLFINANLRF